MTRWWVRLSLHPSGCIATATTVVVTGFSPNPTGQGTGAASVATAAVVGTLYLAKLAGAMVVERALCLPNLVAESGALGGALSLLTWLGYCSC